MGRTRLAVLGATVVALLLSGVSTAVGSGARPAPVGSDPFRAGTAYSGDFPDPTILRVGSTFYAYATTVAALNLPVMTSGNLRTWMPRPAYDPSKPSQNDAMPAGASWAQTKATPKGKVFWPTWAPSVARLGPGRYAAAYAVPRKGDGLHCISIARSSTPLGPFVDSTSAPLTCLGRHGAIDPQLFRDGGRWWLLYKVEGTPDRLVSRRLAASASGFAPSSRNYVLLSPRTSWEGSVVENPAMIRFHGRLYLFYSANGYRSARYATGYAACRTVRGPCTRMGRLLATGPYLAGPGGATPFLDRSGRLRVIYHAWRTGQVGYPSTDGCLRTSAGCPQRRMYVATLAPGKHGRLVVRRRM